MTSLTDDEIALAKKLDAEATAGEWIPAVWSCTSDDGWAAVGPLHGTDEEEGDDEPRSEAWMKARADAAFIAAARTLLPKAIAEVEALRALLADHERLAALDNEEPTT